MNCNCNGENCKPDTSSPYYPYFKVQEGNFNFQQYATFPKMICDYLLDCPVNDYVPTDNNSFPRCRLWKYLYYDGERPLDNPLPTPEQKLSVLFNPDKASEPPTDKDYRLIPQEYIDQSQEKAMTRIYCYMGRTIANQSNDTFTASVIFDIFTHYTYELNTKDGIYSRCGAIVAALLEALNGVNITGIGTFSFAKSLHPDSGTRTIFAGKNVGQQLIIGLKMSGTQPLEEKRISNMFEVSKGVYLV